MDAPMMARVNRERVLLVGGQRALVMQLAHPSVAAGVAQHSDFPARALDRLRRTLDLSLAVIYGSPDQAREATEAIRAVHDRVTGKAGGRPYRANDPELLLWVNATLIDTTLVVYERFVSPLTARDLDRYYRETVDSAERFGIPREVSPPHYEAFRGYMRSMLEGAELEATGDARRLVADVLGPPLPLPLRIPTVAIRQITLALLPDRIREMFELRTGQLSRFALGAASRSTRLLLPWLPSAVRDFSRARAGDGRPGQ